MPRAQYRLTYRETDNPPRWQKKYKGKTYYFPAEIGEKKEASYRRCWQLWLDKKKEIDNSDFIASESPAQKEWKNIMAVGQYWMDKCQTENKPTGYLQAQDIFILARERYLGNYAFNGVDSPNSKPLPAPPEEIKPWEQPVPQENPNSIRAAVAKFLEFKTSQVLHDKCAPGTLANLKLELQKFEEFVGGDTDTNAITAKTVAAYHAHLETSGLGNNYLSNKFMIAKQFIRWCARNDILDVLPKNLQEKNRDLSFPREIKNPKTFTIAQVHNLLSVANDREQLWILLMLNCGLNSIDLGTLEHSHVNWAEGTLTRKRTKTKRRKSAPTVTYKLWPKTLELLRKYRTKSGALLETVNGKPLRSSKLVDGKVQEIDNFRFYFERLQKKSGVTNTAKELRATGASIVSNEFGAEVGYQYLADVPSGILARHYKAPDQSKFDDAIDFLGKKLRIEKL